MAITNDGNQYSPPDDNGRYAGVGRNAAPAGPLAAKIELENRAAVAIGTDSFRSLDVDDQNEFILGVAESWSFASAPPVVRDTIRAAEADIKEDADEGPFQGTWGRDPGNYDDDEPTLAPFRGIPGARPRPGETAQGSYDPDNDGIAPYRGTPGRDDLAGPRPNDTTVGRDRATGPAPFRGVPGRDLGPNVKPAFTSVPGMLNDQIFGKSGY